MLKMNGEIHLTPDMIARVRDAAPLRDCAADSEAVARYVMAASWALEAIGARIAQEAPGHE